MGSIYLLNAGMGEHHAEAGHTLYGADSKSYFDIHVVPPGCQPKEEGDCWYLALYNQAYSRWVGLVRLGRLPI